MTQDTYNNIKRILSEITERVSDDYKKCMDVDGDRLLELNGALGFYIVRVVLEKGVSKFDGERND